jgi:hypothetical protein
VLKKKNVKTTHFPPENKKEKEKELGRTKVRDLRGENEKVRDLRGENEKVRDLRGENEKVRAQIGNRPQLSG